MALPIRMRVRLDGDVADVRVLIEHPMETGLRKDPATGAPIPMHFIQIMTATLNGKPVLEAQWSRAIARNPYIQFHIKGAKPDDEIGIAWTDNLGASNSAVSRVPSGN
jgi:sulfur-oxidizing protein SoxZ